MRITIVGIGAMGSLFAGRLSQVAEVSMLGHWREQLEALQTNGLTLIHPDGRQSQHTVEATSDPATITTAGLVLIMVKSPFTKSAAKAAALSLAPDGIVITLQNGIGNLETIASIVGQNRTALGTTSEGAGMVAPGIVRHAGTGQTFLALQNPGNPASEPNRMKRLHQAAALFNESGFKTELVEQAASLVWGKLAVNAGINPLTALLQEPNGFLIANDDAGWIMEQAATEVASVAHALEIKLPIPNAADQAKQVAARTSANISSMAQDVARGVETEIEAICGAVVENGRRLGIPTPINKTLLLLIRRQTALGYWQDAVENQPPEIRTRLKRLISRKQEK